MTSAPVCPLTSRLLPRPSLAVRVVEFCAGSGFVLLPLAALFPQVHCVLIDCKPRSVQIARDRVAAAGLTNVLVLESRIEVCDVCGIFGGMS